MGATVTVAAVEIRRERQRQGMTQGDLAKKAGVVISTVVNVEKGHTAPRRRTLDKLRKALGVREK